MVGYDDVIKNDTALELDSLEAAYPVLGDGFLRNYITCQQTKSRTGGQARIDDQRVFSTWIGDANAYCDFSRAGGYSVALSAGILQEPFFDARRPPVMNYGGIGFIIGHELSHGFDDIGSQYDAVGVMRPWMSQRTSDEFHRRAEKVARLYDAIPVELDGVSTHVQGRQTLGENIADNGGIRAAWDAYQAAKPDADTRGAAHYGMSADEVFFVSYARTWCAEYTDEYALARTLQNAHPLAQYRVLETLGNFDAFATTFRCPKGSAYAKEPPVTLWRRK